MMREFYNNLKSSMPVQYAKNKNPSLNRYPDGNSFPSPNGIDLTPGELLVCVPSEHGLP